MRKFFLMVSIDLLFFPFYLLCQYSLTGKVIEEKTKMPLDFVTIIIYDSDSTLLKGCITDKNGDFKLNDIQPDDYRVEARMVGYRSKHLTLKIDRDVDLGIIPLEENNIELQEIVVEGTLPPIQQKSDRIIVDVNSFMLTVGKKAFYIIKYLPGVVVTLDNQISVIGKDAVIYINGKPADITGTSVNGILNNLPGDRIESIEIITNPPSRYDAGYSGAIIDIKLKKDESLGYNGSLSMALGIKSTGLVYMPTVNLNFQSKKFNIYGIYGLNNGRYEQKISEQRKFMSLTPPIEYDEHSLYKPSGTNQYARFGVDFFISPIHTIGFLSNTNLYNGGNTNRSTTFIKKIGSSDIDSSIISPINMDIDSKMYSFDLNHKWIIDSNKVLNSDIVYSYADHSQEQKMVLNYYDANNEILHPQKGKGHNVFQKSDAWVIKTDYESTFLGNGRIETGAQFSQIKRNNDLLEFVLNKDSWEEQNSMSNNFTYKEQIAALYFNLSKKWTDFNASLGLRGEQTYQNGYQMANDSSFSHHYFDVFPSASLQYLFKNNQFLSLSYTYKINRPSFSMLNPFKFYTSPNTYTEGNPDLSPSYVHNIQLQYNQRRFFVTLSYSEYDGLFIQEPFQNDESQEFSYTYKNFGSAKIYAVLLNVPFRISKWWNLNFNGNGYYRDYKSRFMGDDFNLSFFNGSFQINNQFIINNGIKLELNGFLSSSNRNIATKIDRMGSLDLTLQKTLCNRKGNLSISLQDPFRWNQFKSVLKYKNIDATSHIIPDMRMLRISFTYNLGSDKVKQSRKRNTGIESIEERMK